MGIHEKRILLSDPYHDPDDGPLMEFRLTYSGLLFSTGNDSQMRGDRRGDHKHAIRLAFHPQLKRLWEITEFLALEGHKKPNYKPARLAKKHAHFGWNFVPLVSEELDLMCGVDVLFLCPRRPGGIVNQGDIDDRLKTLLDALAIPDANQGYESRTPEKSETPLYVLLENDRMITKVSVETDQLLEFVTPNRDVNEVRLIITVRICDYE